MNQFSLQIRRLHVLIALLAVLISVLLFRAGYLVTTERGFLLEESQKRVHKSETIQATRGAIVDRNNEPLAVSTVTYTLSFDPARVKWTGRDLQLMSDVLGMHSSDIEKLITPQSRYKVLARGISVEDRLQLASIKGLKFTPQSRRFYSLGEAGASLVGIVNHSQKGIVGIEQFYHADLSPLDGKIEYDVDATGNIVGQKQLSLAAKNGRTVKLTVDKMLQSELYFLLSKAVKTYQAESGIILVSEVKTGDVLAMVNFPSFNPNEPISQHNVITPNRAVQTRFEPGSTIKPIWLAWLLSKGYIDADMKIKTSPGVMQVEGGVIRDAKDHGTLSLTGVLKKSSNVAMSKLLLDIEPQVIEQMMIDMRLSHHHAIGLPGEISGSENLQTDKSLFAKVSVSFGYGIAVTPLELLRAYSIIAAGGNDRPLRVLVNQQNTPHAVLNTDSVKAVSDMLHAVVSDGTGWRAKIKGIEVAGKTGTSHRLIDGQYDQSHRASFVGYAPWKDPKYVILVILDAPKGNAHFGGTSAAPLFAKALERVISFDKRNNHL